MPSLKKRPGPGVPAGYDTLRLQLLSPWVFQIPGGTAHRILKNSRSSSVQYLTKHCGTLSTFTYSLPEESLLLCWTLLKDGLFSQLYKLCGFHMRADADIHYSSSRPPRPDFAESWEELWIKLKHARPQQLGSHISGTPTVLKPQNLLPELWLTGLNMEGCSFQMRIRASLVLEFKSRFKTTGEHLQYSTHSCTSAGFPAGSRKHFFERSTPSAMLHDHQSDKSRPEHPKIDQPTWPMVIFYHPDPSFNCFNHAKNMTQCAPQSGAWSSA